MINVKKGKYVILLIQISYAEACIWVAILLIRGRRYYNVCSEPRYVRSEPRYVRSEPRYVRSEPRYVRSEPSFFPLKMQCA